MNDSAEKSAVDSFETFLTWIVRYSFGALLAITLYLFSAVVVIYLFDEPHGVSRAWLPFFMVIDFVLTCCCVVFATVQWHRLPKKWYVIALDTLVGGLLLFGIIWSVNGGR
jgi:hypothetical protein